MFGLRRTRSSELARRAPPFRFIVPASLRAESGVWASFKVASAESESSGRGRARRADCSSEGLALRCFKTGKPYFRPALVGCVELRHAIHRRICGFRVVPRSPSSNVLEATARQLHRLVSFGTSAWLHAWLLGTSASPCLSAHRPGYLAHRPRLVFVSFRHIGLWLVVGSSCPWVVPHAHCRLLLLVGAGDACPPQLAEHTVD